LECGKQMGKTKKQRQTHEAHKNRSILCNSSGPRSKNSFPQLFPCKAINAPPKDLKRKRYPPEVFSSPINLKRRKKKLKAKFEEPLRQTLRSDIMCLRRSEASLLKVKLKWIAICRVKENMIDGKVSKRIYQSLSREFNVSDRTLRNWVSQANQGYSMMRDDGSGRKEFKFDSGERTLREIYDEYGGELSQATLTELICVKGETLNYSTYSCFTKMDHKEKVFLKQRVELWRLFWHAMGQMSIRSHGP
jgi:hypothetical protein